jgi:hypothetical protein
MDAFIYLAHHHPWVLALLALWAASMTAAILYFAPAGQDRDPAEDLTPPPTHNPKGNQFPHPGDLVSH